MLGDIGWLAKGYALKISVLSLNIGSGMLRLRSSMLRLSLTSSIQGGLSPRCLPHLWPPWTEEVGGKAAPELVCAEPEHA